VGENAHLRRLNDFEREGHVGRPGDAGKIAGDFCRVVGLSMLEVVLLLCSRGWQIRDGSALHDALPRGKVQSPGVILQVPGSAVQHRPDAAKIRFAVRTAWDVAGLSLSNGRDNRQKHRENGLEPRSALWSHAA